MRTSGRRLWPGALLTLVLFSSSATRAQAPGGGMVHLWRYSNSGIDYPLRAVVRDSAAFARIWREARRRILGDTTAPPSVDFHRYMVVVAAMGEKMWASYGIRIDALDSTSDALYVRVAMSGPGEGCASGAEARYPIDIVRLPATHKTVAFVDRYTASHCGG